MAIFDRSKHLKGKPKRNKKKTSARSSNSGRSNKRDFSKFGRKDSPRRESSRAELTTVTCDSCRAKCEVPFKPTSNKPVYCSSCFRKEETKAKYDNNGSSDELAEINKKLDKIMRTLKIK